MEGILIQVNKNIVQIDTKFYTVAEPKYVPTEMNIPVTFETDQANPTLIKFIKRSVPKDTATSVKKYPSSEEKKEFTPRTYQKKPYSYGKSKEEQDTIKRQAIGHMASRTLIGSGLKGPELELAIKKLYALFQELVG